MPSFVGSSFFCATRSTYGLGFFMLTQRAYKKLDQSPWTTREMDVSLTHPD